MIVSKNEKAGVQILKHAGAAGRSKISRGIRELIPAFVKRRLRIGSILPVRS
ncbi:hypothetical protein [Afipia felis]